MYTWKRLSQLCDGTTPEALRSEALNNAHIATGYIDRNLWYVVDQHPYCLCHGDIRHNLELLRDASPQCHPMAKALQSLLKAGYEPFWELVDVIKLLAIMRCSTNATEEAHASTTLMKRYHPGYFWQKVAMRAYLHIVWPLIRQPPKDGKLRRLEIHLACLEKKQPEKANGVSALVQVMNKAAHRLADRANSNSFRNTATRTNLILNTSLWSYLSPAPHPPTHTAIKPQPPEISGLISGFTDISYLFGAFHPILNPDLRRRP